MQARLRTDGKCLRVIDGDTLLCRIICPCCRVESEQRVRLSRIDAPELKGSDRAKGLLSKKRLAETVEGMAIKVSVTRAWPDRYGRVLAEVEVAGINLSDMMLAHGLAVEWRAAPPTCYDS